MHRSPLLSLFILLLSLHYASGQTCCSGGVPLTGNIGMPSQPKGTFQLNAAYDLNVLRTLKDGDTNLNDDSRRRLIQTVFSEMGYSVSESFLISLFIPYIWQERKISRNENTDVVKTSGIGDITLYSSYKWDLLQKRYIIDLGLGIKTPTGAADLVRDDGIPLNADLQPGSGAWDIIARGAFTHALRSRPTASLSLIGMYTRRGKNKQYLGEQSYKFGNEWQLWFTYNDQFVSGKSLLTELFSIRYRNALGDEINDFVVPSTGGIWLDIYNQTGYWITQNTNIYLGIGIPVYNNLNGTQLTTTFRMLAGIYYTIGTKKVGNNINQISP